MSRKHSSTANSASGAAKSAWDGYWQASRGAACQGDLSGRYRGIIGSLWREWFAALPPAQRVLDLATGNGAVVELALEAVSDVQLPMVIHGIDQARIRPRLSRAPRPGFQCRWHPKVAVDALPFAAEMFDAVTSQYGVEYGDLDRAVAEVRRVLRPGGRIFWICHYRGGDIARDSKREAEQSEQILAMSLPRLIIELLKLQYRDGGWVVHSHQATRNSREARQVQRALAEAFQVAGNRPGQAGGNLALYLNNLAHLYQHREQHAFDKVIELFQECDRELRFHLARIKALVDAALTDQDVHRLQSSLSTAGLQPHGDGPVSEPASGRVVGYAFRWFLPGAANTTIPSTDSQALIDLNHQVPAPVWSWSEYWREGAVTTFGQWGFEDGYDGAVGLFWERLFSELAHGGRANARIVDLGCGNGAVALLAARVADRLGLGWRIIGIDSADVELPQNVLDSLPVGTPSSVELSRLTSMERTGLDDGSVDLVVSQFGLEYGDLNAALCEARRICRMTGRMALILHHPRSTVVRQARQYLGEVLGCLKEPLIASDRISELATLAARKALSQSQRSRYDELLTGLHTLRSSLAHRGASHAVRVVENYLRVCAPEFEGRTAAERLEFIERFGDSLGAYIGRMRTLDEAVLDDTSFSDLVDRCSELGWKVTETDLVRRDQGPLLARTLLATPC